MKIHAIRINKIFFTSMLILSLGYTGTLTFTTSVEVDDLTIAAGDKIIVNTGKTVTVNGAVSITGILQMDGTSVVDATGDVTVEGAGTLDMNGSSRLKTEGHLTFNGGTLDPEDGTGIDMDGGSSQNITGTTIVGEFKSITCRRNATVFNLTAIIEDSLDTGGQNFTISGSKTLTMDAGSIVVVSGGTWTRTGTLLLNATSTVKYTGSATAMQPETYGNLIHDGGILSQEAGGTLTVAGTFTNTSGNFAASQPITAKGIVWDNNQVTGSPSQTWDIGTDGITINGGTLTATTGTFTVAGNWTNAGTATLTGSTVNFDGTTAQAITSGGSAFNNVTISNTTATVSLADAFSSSGTFTIAATATFATAGQGFTGGVTIANSGIFQMHGDETTTVGLSIDGVTEFVSNGGATTLTPTLNGLEDVTFDANAQTISFGESIDYLTGDITVAVGTTVQMATFNLTVQAGKEIENNGTWDVPSTPSTLICAGSATFSGVNGMSFYNFSAQVASSVLTFQRSKTYTVRKDLTLVGADGTEIHLVSDNQVTKAFISNQTAWHTGTQNVDYCKMEAVDGDAGNPAIVATNSWDINGDLTKWDFGPMTYTYQTTGNWSVTGNWFEGVLPSATDNIIVPNAVQLTLGGDITINDVTIATGGEIVVGDDEFTINGASDIDGTITAGAGTIDAEGAFSAENGTIDINGAGDLKLAGTVANLGDLSIDFGTVTYDGPADQDILADAYYSLTAGGGAGTKSLLGAVTCADAFTVDADVTVDMDGNTIGVTGATDIDGILTVAGSTLTLDGASVVGGTITVVAGTVDANGAFNATGGNLTFTGAGNLQLAGDVTNLGTLTGADFGTVTYDGGSQNLFGPQTYVNLVAGGTGTKTLLGTVTVSGTFTSNASVTTAMGAFDLDVAGATDINGIVTIVTGTLDAEGAFDAAGAGDATGGIINLTGAGHLELAGNVTSLGVLTDATHGTVTYDGGGDQNIVADSYVNLIAGGGGGIKSLLGAVIVAGTFTTDGSVTTAMGTFDLDVAGATTIPGTVTMTTGTLDTEGTFDATGGTIDINGAGELQLAATTPNLGILSTDFGKVTYDGTTQTIFADTYYDLTAGNANTKTLGGVVNIERDLTIGAGVTLDVSTDDYAINIKRHFTNSGTFTMQEGLVTFNGSNDQALTTGGSSFYAITFNTTGAATKALTLVDALVMTNNLTITAGTMDLNAMTLNIAGDLTIANNANWTKGGLVTFNGGATQQFADGNTPPNNLGNISID